MGALRQFRADFDDEEMLRLISSLSRYVAFHGTDKTLSKWLGWDLSRVRRCLDRLSLQRIERVTSAPRHDESGFSRTRTIYIVSRYSDERGALLLANWVRRRAQETEFRVSRICGQLQCTPRQLDRWKSLAIRDGYLKEGSREGKPTLVRVGEFPRVDLPAAPEWTGPRVLPSAAERVLEFVRNRDCSIATNTAAVAQSVPCGKPYARELLRALVKEKRIYMQECEGGRKVLSLSPVPASQGSVRRVQRVQREIVRVLTENGPTNAKGLRLALPYGFTKTALVGIDALGVACERLGGTAWWSVGPLPEEFKAQMERRRREAKRDRDRVRRRRLREGLSGDEDAFIRDFVENLGSHLFEAHRHTVPKAREYTLDQHCRSLAKDIPRADVVREYAALRKDSGVVDRFRLARAVMASRRKQAA